MQAARVEREAVRDAERSGRDMLAANSVAEAYRFDAASTPRGPDLKVIRVVVRATRPVDADIEPQLACERVAKADAARRLARRVGKSRMPAPVAARAGEAEQRP